jgi:hypothetical protein
MTLKPDDILAMYRRLQKAPSGETHRKLYVDFKNTVRTNQDVLYDLIFSGKVTDHKELYNLIMSGSDGGTMKKEANENWIPFISRIWERHNELPERVMGSGGIEWVAAQWGIIE